VLLSECDTVQLDAAIASGLASTGFVDVLQALPALVGPRDLPLLLQASEAAKPWLEDGAKLMAEHFLVSSKLLEWSQAAASREGTETAERDLIRGLVHSCSCVAGMAVASVVMCANV
jgi:hypothetical protein